MKALRRIGLLSLGLGVSGIMNASLVDDLNARLKKKPIVVTKKSEAVQEDCLTYGFNVDALAKGDFQIATSYLTPEEFMESMCYFDYDEISSNLNPSNEDRAFVGRTVVVFPNARPDQFTVKELLNKKLLEATLIDQTFEVDSDASVKTKKTIAGLATIKSKLTYFDFNLKTGESHGVWSLDGHNTAPFDLDSFMERFAQYLPEGLTPDFIYGSFTMPEELSGWSYGGRVFNALYKLDGNATLQVSLKFGGLKNETFNWVWRGVVGRMPAGYTEETAKSLTNIRIYLAGKK